MILPISPESIYLNKLDEYLDLFSNFLSGKNIESFDVKIKHKDGNLRHLKEYPSILRSGDKIIGIQIITREIT